MRLMGYRKLNFDIYAVFLIVHSMTTNLCAIKDSLYSNMRRNILIILCIYNSLLLHWTYNLKKEYTYLYHYNLDRLLRVISKQFYYQNPNPIIHVLQDLGFTYANKLLWERDCLKHQGTCLHDKITKTIQFFVFSNAD